MIKFIKIIQARRRLAKHYKPQKAFINQTRDIFLKATHSQFGHVRSSYSSVRPFARGLAVGIAGMLLIGGMTTYADQSNVSPSNILYPLKRVNETVRLSFTDQAQKPAYHAELAEKRLAEFEKTNMKISAKQAEELALAVGEEMDKSLEILEVVGIPEQIPQAETATQPIASFVSAGEVRENIFFQERLVPKPTSSENGDKSGKTKVIIDEHQACRSISRLMDKKTLAVAQALEKYEKLEERFKKLCEHEEEEED